MALRASLGVINGAQAIGDFVSLFESSFVGVKLSLRSKPVEYVVKASWGFGCALTLDGTRIREWQHESRREKQKNRNLQDSHL
jgi:hypothetical protein